MVCLPFYRGNATHRNAEQSIAEHRKARHGTAAQSIEGHGNATQRKVNNNQFSQVGYQG